MRFVVPIRVLAALILVSAFAALAQVPEPRKTKPEEKESVEVGPVTAKTKDEAEEAVKAPSTVPRELTAAPIDPKSYIIGAEDILLIRVWREPELSGATQVRPDGKITMALIGEQQAAGLTPDTLKTKLTEALSEYLNKPEVIVGLQAVLSKKYHITGEINRTGSFPLIVPTTILEALTNAGGFREFASTKKIHVLRKGKKLKFNYNDVVNGKNMEQNIYIEAGDYIVVP